MDIKTVIREILNDETLPNEMKVIDLAHLVEEVHKEGLNIRDTDLTNHRIRELESEIGELKEKIDELASERSRAKKQIAKLQSRLKTASQ